MSATGSNAIGFLSALSPPRLRFTLALAAAVLLYFGCTPPRTAPWHTAVAMVVIAITVLGFLIAAIAIFGAAERSDGRASR